MAVGLSATGVVGLAYETTPGTYVAPTKYFPIRSESLMWTQTTNQRRVIRNIADVQGVVAGNGFVEGEIEVEMLSTVLPYFLYAARGTVDKTDTAGVAPFTYEFVPNAKIKPFNTISISIERNGVVFGYVGCQVTSMSFSVDNEWGVMTLGIIGTNEATQAALTPTYGTDTPYGAGKWTVEIPTTTQVFDTDTFTFEVDDGGEAQNRLKNTLGAQFVAYGERSVTLSVDRDFENRTEYDAYKAYTSKSITIKASNNASNDEVALLMPVAFVDSYEVSLSGVADVVRASISYLGAHDNATPGAYKITVKSTEDVTEPAGN